MSELTEAERVTLAAAVKDAFYEARDQGRTMHQAAEDDRIGAAVEAILRDRLATVAAERDTLATRRDSQARLALAYANRLQTAGAEVARLRAENADLRTTEAILRGEIRRSESALATFDDVNERRIKAEQTSAAQAQVLADVAATLDLMAEMRAKNGDVRFGADAVIKRVRADLAALAPLDAPAEEES